MRVTLTVCVRLALFLAVGLPSAMAQFDLLPGPANGDGKTQVRPADTGAIVPSPFNDVPVNLVKSDPNYERTEGNIAGRLPLFLESWQYTHHPFDAEISSKFLDRYLDSLDHYHVLFFQSDLKQFEGYRTNLQRLTLSRDISPAETMFARFLQRATERTMYVTNLLATGEFVFTNHERFTPDRHALPNPKDLAEAELFWRQELRSEYLDEKLKESDMALSGAVSFDAQSNVLVTLPPVYTNASAVTVSTPDTNGYRKVPAMLPAKFLDKEGHEFGSLATMESNVVVHLQIGPEGTAHKVTNNFFAADGARLGSIHFVRELETGADGTNTANGTNGVQDDATALGKTAAPTVKAVIDLNEKDVFEIRHNLTKRYVSLLKNYNEITNDDYVLEGYLTSLAHAYDPHSDYMGHASTENFDIQMHLSLSGIGARLRSEDGNCKIDDLVPEGPAAKSGQITNEDMIVAVAQKGQDPVEVTGMPLLKVVEMIRGPKGTPVTLTVVKAHPTDPAVHKQNVTIVRDVIKLEDQAAKAKFYETPSTSSSPPTRIGVIDLPSFYGDSAEPDVPGELPHIHSSTSIDVARLVARMMKENADGVILDLRRNGGGFLDEAIKLTGLFVPGKVPVVQTKDSEGMIEVDSTPRRPALYSGPLIVLTSRFSASASEIVAGALQDYGRALIVGDKSTFGKGSVQTVQTLSNAMRTTLAYDPGSLKVTIKKFYRAAGSSTQSNGVVSDIALPSVLNYADVGESSLANPMPWDEISSADPPDMNQVKPYLLELTKRSEQRRATDKDFAYIQEDIDQYRKTLADKSISLNEAERLAELKENEARAAARNKERSARPRSGEKIYEITMKNVDQPTLQVPDVKAAKPTAPVDDDADPLDATATPDANAADPTLTEARHILTDYISLMKKPVAAAVEKGQ